MERVDVFIPYHIKDRHALPHAVRSAFRHLVPRPAHVVCVGAELPADSAQAVRAAGGELLDERLVAEVPHRSVMPEITVNGQVRTGWYYQQFLKWAFRRLATTPAYVVLDADSLLVGPLVLWQDGRYVLDRSDQQHVPYFDVFEQLLGWRPVPGESFIINYQIIDVALLDTLIAEIETRAAGQPWHERILAVIDRTEVSGFSEFETYGYWLSQHQPTAFIARRGANHETRLKRLPFRHLINPWMRLRGFTTVSYHQSKRS